MNTEDTLYNIAFERTILSSIIFEPSSFEDIIGLVKADDFYLPAHQKIYIAISTLFNADKPIDEEFLKNELVGMNCFDEMVMLEILAANPISNTKAYIEEMIEKSKVRQLIGLAGTIKKHAIEELDNSDSIISRVESDLEKIADVNATDFGIINIEDIQDSETEFILKEWIPLPRGTVTIIAAPGGTGKSWTALQMAIRHNIETGRTSALWLSEDPLYETKSRSKMILNDIVGTQANMKNIRLVSRAPIALMTQKRFSYADFYKIKKALKDYDLIVLDPLLAMYGSDENDNSQARMFMQPFMDWAKETNKCIVFLHHSKKGGDGSKVRGAGAFVDACRTVYEIEKIDEDDSSGKRNVVLSKDNYGAIKHLKSFKVQRQITSRRAPIPIVQETIYDSKLPFLGTKTNQTFVDNDNISIEGANFL